MGDVEELAERWGIVELVFIPEPYSGLTCTLARYSARAAAAARLWRLRGVLWASLRWAINNF